MVPGYVFQVSLWVTVQNQIRIAKRVIVNKIVQLRSLRHGHIQRIFNPGAVNGDHSPIPEQQFHTAAGKEPELVGAKPFILANARPFGRSKAPLGLSLLRKRGILLSEENKKSEPFSYREKVRIFIRKRAAKSLIARRAFISFPYTSPSPASSQLRGQRHSGGPALPDPAHRYNGLP